MCRACMYQDLKNEKKTKKTKHLQGLGLEISKKIGKSHKLPGSAEKNN